MLSDRLSTTELWLLRHATRSNHWATTRRGTALSTIRNQWVSIYRKLHIPGKQHKRLPALMRAVGLGLVTLDEIDRADDERRWPSGWHWGWCPEWQDELG
jgi:hypothetical protein